MLWVTARPGMFKRTQAEWISKAAHPENIVTKVAVDTDDNKSLLPEFDVLVTNPPCPGVAFPAYELTTTYDITSLDDIIILASDDFHPPNNWDVFIQENMDKKCCLLVNDGLVRKDAKAVTLPILDGYAFIALNKIIYHKAYRHMFSDVELYHNCQKLKLLKNLRGVKVIFKHHHYTKGMRAKDSMDFCNQKFFYDDKEKFENRMKKSIGARLKVEK